MQIRARRIMNKSPKKLLGVLVMVLLALISIFFCFLYIYIYMPTHTYLTHIICLNIHIFLNKTSLNAGKGFTIYASFSLIPPSPNQNFGSAW